MPSSPEHPRISLTEPRAKRFRLGLWKGVWRSTYIDFACMKAKEEAREQQRFVMPSSAAEATLFESDVEADMEKVNVHMKPTGTQSKESKEELETRRTFPKRKGGPQRGI